MSGRSVCGLCAETSTAFTAITDVNVIDQMSAVPDDDSVLEILLQQVVAVFVVERTREVHVVEMMMAERILGGERRLNRLELRRRVGREDFDS